MSIEITNNLINGPGNVPPPTPPTAPTSPTSPTPPVPAVCGRVFVGVGSTLVVIDAATGSVIDVIELGDASSSFYVTVDPFNERVFVSTSYGGDLLVFDARTLAPIADITLGYQVNEAVYSPVNNLLYVASEAGGFIDILNGDTLEQVSRITNLNGPVRFVYDSRTDFVYATNYNANNITVIAGLEVVQQVVVGPSPSHIALNPVTGLIYVSVRSGLSVAVIDTATNIVVAQIPQPFVPFGVAANPLTNRFYVVQGNSVDVYDGTTNQLIDTLSTGIYPWAIALTPTLNRGFVTNRTSQTVSMIDLTTDEVLADISVDGTPINIAALEFIC